MNLTTERADILAALTKVAGIVQRKTTIDIIANVLIDARKNGDVHLRATNLDMEATAVFRGNVSEPGVITTPAGTLLDIVKNLDAGADLSLAMGDVRLKLSSGRSKFNLPVLPASAFPSIPVVNSDMSLNIGAATLARMFEDVAFSRGVDEARFFLTGIYLHNLDGRLAAVGCSSHRLARSVGPEIEADIKAILPADFVANAVRLLADMEDCTLTVGESMVSLAVGSTTLTSKLIGGAYAEYQRIIPDNPHTLTVGRSALEGAVRRAMIMGSTAVKLDIGSSALIVTARGENSGDALDEISCEFDGGEMRYALRGTYLTEVLAHMSSEMAVIRLNTAKQAMFVSEPGSADLGFVIGPQLA